VTLPAVDMPDTAETIPTSGDTFVPLPTVA